MAARKGRKGVGRGWWYVGEYVARQGLAQGRIYTVGPQRPPAIFHHYADTTLGLVSIYLSVSPFRPFLSLSLSNPKRKRKEGSSLFHNANVDVRKLALEIG